MSDTDVEWLGLLAWIVPMLSVLVGYAIGFRHGWSLGKKSGEADGVAWATKRLRSLR